MVGTREGGRKDRRGTDREGQREQQTKGEQEGGRKRKTERKGRKGRKRNEKRDGRSRRGEWKGSRNLSPRSLIKVGASEQRNIYAHIMCVV